MAEGNGAVAMQKMTKIDAKRMKDREERRRRLVNNGVPLDRVDETLAWEDHNNLPTDKRLEKLEKLVVKLFQGLQRDIMSLQHNDGVITDALDINLRAMAKCLEKAGVDRDQQGVIITEVETELREEQRKALEARQAAERAAEEASVLERMKAEVSKKPTLVGSEEEQAPVVIPDGATVFEG